MLSFSYVLVNYDGTLKDKSAMGRFVGKNIEDVTNSNGSTVWIIDAMALIQHLKNIVHMFDELSVTVQLLNVVAQESTSFLTDTQT